MSNEYKVLTSIVVIIIVAVICSFVFPFSNTQENISEDDKDIIEIPFDSKIKINKKWQINLDTQQSDYTIADGLLYIVTYSNTIYIIDIASGDMIKSFEIASNEKEDYHCNGIDVYKDHMVINYSNMFLVIDLKNEDIVFSHKTSISPIVSLKYNSIIYNDLVIFCDIRKEQVCAINYNTGKIEWIHKNGKNGMKYTLKLINDDYIIINVIANIIYEFNPENGEIIHQYSVKFTDTISNDKISTTIPIIEGLHDKEKEVLLKDIMYGVFTYTSKGYVYSKYKNDLFFHGKSKEILWNLTFSKDIYNTVQYGKYTFLNFSDNITLVDLEKKQVLWNITYNVADKARIFIYNDVLYIPNKNGLLVAFDLSDI